MEEKFFDVVIFHFSASPTEEFDRFCHKSEELMDQCMLVETSENASTALKYCNAAIGKIS